MCEGYCVEYVVFISVHELLKCNNIIDPYNLEKTNLRKIRLCKRKKPHKINHEACTNSNK